MEKPAIASTLIAYDLFVMNTQDKIVEAFVYYRDEFLDLFQTGDIEDING